jgi:Ca2+-transporting ATPase
VIAGKQKAGMLLLRLHQRTSPVVHLPAAAGGLAIDFGDWREAAAV